MTTIDNNNGLGARMIDMKSIQPYGTRDEYLYAMKEDLAEWFNSMYFTEASSGGIEAETFVEQLENGVIICSHANAVMRSAIAREHRFDSIDLQNAGILGSTKANVLATPNGKGANWAGEFILYRADARPQSFQARDNIANFIRWCRFICKVREVLMFETEDLILRKNEKNFILCLLEVARFGSKFGVQVPTIVRMEQEIQAEIEAEMEREKSAAAALLTAAIEPEETATIVLKKEIEEEEEMLVLYLENNKKSASNTATTKGSVLVEERELNSNGSYDEATNSSVSEEDEPSTSSSSSNPVALATDQTNNVDKFVVVASCTVSSSCDDDDDDVAEAEIVGKVEKSKSFSDSLENLTNYNTLNMEMNNTSEQQTATLRNETNQSPSTRTLEALALDGDYESGANSSSTDDTETRDDSSSTSQPQILDSEIINSLSSAALQQAAPAEIIVVETITTATIAPTQETQPNPSSLVPSPLSTSISSSSSCHAPIAQIEEPLPQKEQVVIADKPLVKQEDIVKVTLPPPKPPTQKVAARNLNDLFKSSANSDHSKIKASSDIQRIEAYLNETSENQRLKSGGGNRSRSASRDRSVGVANSVSGTSVKAGGHHHHQSQTNLHVHVCSIADRCTCEMQFPVVKIGEGKYRIGNTKNIVFIRILRNHIMVRVGGGWDTLENYLNKHDPCRCVSSNNNNNESTASHFSGARQRSTHTDHNSESTNILLTPVSTNQTSSNQSDPERTPLQPRPSATLVTPSCSLHQYNNTHLKPSVDFTDAKLLIERNTDGKHVVGKILLNKTTATSTNEIPRSSSNINLATPNTTSSSSVVVVSSQQKHASNIVSGSSYAPLSLANFNLNNNNNSDAGEMNSLMRNANNFFFSSSSSSAHSSSSSTSSASSTSTKPSGDAAAKKQPIANSTSLNAIQHLQSGSGPTTTSLSSPGTLRVKMKKLINKLPIQHNEHHNESEDNRSQNSGNTPSNGSGGIFRNSSKSSSSSSNRNGGGTLFRLRHEDAANSSGGASPRKTSADTKASDFLADLVSINKIEPSNVYTDTILPARLHRPIYTETNLPPRLLRKYEKRANTDANLLNANNMLLTSVQSVLSDKQQQNSDSLDIDSNDKPTIIDSPNKEQTEKSEVNLDYVKSESPDPIKLFESGRIEGQEEEKREKKEESVSVDRNQEAAEEEEEEEEPISGLAKKGAFEPRPPPRANRYKKYAKYNKSNTADLSRHIIVEQDSLSSPPSQKALLQRRHSNKENEEEDADSLEGVEAVTSTSISNSKIETTTTTTTTSSENSEKNTSELTKTSSISSSDENKIKDEGEEEEDDEENRTEFNDSLESLNQKSKNPTTNGGGAKKRTSIGSEHSADILDTAEIDKLLMSMDTRLKVPVSQSDENSLSLLLMPAANRVDTNPSITTTTTTTTTTATTVIARQSRWRSSSSSSSISTSDEAKSGSVVPVVSSVSAHDATAASTASRRAQWDKSAQEFDYKSQFLMNSVQPPPRKPSSNTTTTTTTPSKSRAQSSAPPSKVVVAHVKTNLNTESSTTPQPTQTTKKARNLKLAKEQLYEMKRTIDARVIPNQLNSTEYSSSSSSITTSSSVTNRQQPPTMVNSPFNSKQTMRQPIAVAATSLGVRATPATTNGERTTPRKVKKRSGERSLTTGIIFDQSNALMSVDDDSEVANATNTLNQSRTNLSKTPLKSSSSQLAAWSSAARPTQSSLLKARQASSSLHNLATAHNHPDHARSMTPTAQRLRRDSAASTASSATCLSAAGASLCYPSADYKENKASELRKKSALMNKIILKSQLVNDPIFARANPIHQEIALVEQQQFMNDETLNFISDAINNDSTIASSSASSSSARKRLFVKKGERAFDPNASSASSTTSSSTASAFHPTIGREKRTVPTSMNFMNGLESPISSSPMQMKTSSPLGRTKSPSSPLKREQSASSSSSSSPSSKTLPSWARSSNDLVLLSQQQRTNSQRDLLELMNNCVSPRGDAEAYRRMTEECEEMRAKISSSTTPTPSGRKPRKMASRTTTERIIVDEPPLETPADLNNSINSSSSSSMSPKTRRSTSMPSYEQPANDTTLDEFMSGFVNLNCPEQAALLK